MSRAAGMTLFFSFALSIVGSIHYYLWARLVRDPAWPLPWRYVGAAVIVMLALSIPSLFIFARGLGVELPRGVLWAVFSWMGVMFFLLVLLAVSDVTRLIAGGVLKIAHAGTGLTSPERRSALARLVGGGVMLLALGTSVVATRSALAGPALRFVRVPLRRISQALAGLRIVQLSDLHLGPTIDGEFLADIVRRTNELQPDIIAITGDLVDDSVPALRDAVASLAQLRARYGVYFVTGNHEYYVGVEGWLVELRRLGIRVLRNERVRVGEGAASFDVAGVDDWSAHQFGNGHGADLAKALAGRDANVPVVLLAHQPRAIHEAAARGVDLQLSGHTHGGQIWPFGYLVKLTQPYLDGLHQHGESAIYVSRGTGYWGPPMRLGGRSEISVLELAAGDATPAQA
ncbi:MAG: metallophosphoesterase [Myxococcota bacterium]